MTTCYSEDRRCPPADRTPLCDDHLAITTRAIRLLGYDHADLNDHLPKSLGEWGQGQPVGTAALPVPIRLDVEALQRHIWRLAVGWARIAAIRAGLTLLPDTPVRDSYALAWAIRILEPRIDMLARVGPVRTTRYPMLDDDQPPPTVVCGADGVLDLAAAHSRAHAVLGLTNLVRRLPGYCQHHDQASGYCVRRLFQDNGSDTVYCEAGHRITRDDYEVYGNLFLRPKETAA